MSHEGKKTKPVPPGRILAGAEVARLIDLKFPTRNEFAYKAGLDPKKVSDLVNGRKKMDANIASQLAKLLEKDEAFFWHLFAEDAHSQSNSPEAPINDRVDQNTVNSHSRLIAEAEARNMIRFVAEGRALELPLDTPAERVRVLSDIFFGR